MKNDGLVHKIGPIRGWNRKNDGLVHKIGLIRGWNRKNDGTVHILTAFCGCELHAIVM